MRMDDSPSINTEVHLSCIDSWWKKTEGKLSVLFNEVWPRWGVCLYACVLLCKCVSDAANCPFAVYPMGSGMSLVTACSFSLNGPVAMAAPQRPAPPPQRMESDRPIRAGRCDMQTAVITALRRRGARQGRPYTGKVPTRSISKQTRWAGAPGGHVGSESATSSSLHYTWHLPSRAVSCDTSGKSNTNYTTQRALGTHQTPTGWLSCVILCLRSSSPVTHHTHTALP